MNLYALAVFSIVLCLAGCSENGGQALEEEKSIGESAKKLTGALGGFAKRQSESIADQLDNLAESLGERMSEGKDAFADAVSQALEDTDEEIKKLEKRAKDESGDTQESSRKAARKLREQRDKLVRQLQTLRASGDDAWKEVAEAFNKGLTELSKELGKLDRE